MIFRIYVWTVLTLMIGCLVNLLGIFEGWALAAPAIQYIRSEMIHADL